MSKAMNMREKMARVYARQAAEYFGVPGVNLFVETNWEDFAPDAILDAMREPSEEMIKDIAHTGEEYQTGTFSAVKGYVAGIDAIKAGK